MKDKEKKMLFGIGIVFLFLASVGFSYAYFTASIANKDVKDQVVTTGTLELTYTDGAEIKMLNIKPGQTITKKVTVKNTGTLDTAYNFVWQELNNTILNNEMIMSVTCKRLNGNTEEETCEGVDEAPIKSNNIKKKVSIEPGITHEYNVTITFIESDTNQNYNQGKSFSGVLGINEYVYVPRTLSNNYLEIAGLTNRYYISSLSFYSDNRVIDGAKVYDVSEDQDNSVKLYVKTNETDSTLSDLSIVADGIISFPEDSTKLLAVGEPVNYGAAISQLHELSFNNSISTSNVKNMSYMFAYTSELENLDLNSFDTSKVTDMNNMFNTCKATIAGFDKFNTSKVKDMNNMFYNSYFLTPLDLSSFDTSNVTDMSYMFCSTRCENINISGFNTSKVTDMGSMFQNSAASSLDLSSFDTSNVTNMDGMFRGSSATSLDLSSFNVQNVINMSSMFDNSTATSIKFKEFNTSKVTDMKAMFANSKATSLDLSSFDTSNVINMDGMFYNSQATRLDLSSFNTSKVTDMGQMFESSYAETIDLSSFNTSGVTNMCNMFASSKATTIDASSFDTSNVTNMDGMFERSYATTIDVSSFDTSNVTNMYVIFFDCPNLKTIYASEKFVTTNVVSSDLTFEFSTKLVGGAGTVYDKNHVTRLYARIDGGTSSPGYFTLKTN